MITRGGRTENGWYHVDSRPVCFTRTDHEGKIDKCCETTGTSCHDFGRCRQMWFRTCDFHLTFSQHSASRIFWTKLAKT
jgi:hypothetical protein